MCGIVGYSGKEKMDVDDLKVMLCYAQQRGTDSTGVATPVSQLKKAEEAFEFIKRDIPTHKTVIGHTRGATTGSVTDENAHPFTSGALVGIHNGIIGNFEALQEKEDTNFDVDSEIIWYLFNKYGYKEALPMLRGWMALAWIDEDDRLNLYRHSAPIHIGKKNDQFYFASTKEYLKAVDCEEIEELEEHHRFIINDGKIVTKINMEDCKPKRKSYVSRDMPWSNNDRWKNKEKGGQNTQDGEEQEAYDAEYYPKSDAVPSYTNFVLGTDIENVGFYYWRGVNNTKELFIQASSPEIGALPQVMKFNLNKAVHVHKLHANYPDVYYSKDVIKDIPDNLK